VLSRSRRSERLSRIARNISPRERERYHAAGRGEAQEPLRLSPEFVTVPVSIRRVDARSDQQGH